MKTTIFIVTLGFLSTVARMTISAPHETRDRVDRQTKFTMIKWIGTLRCQEQETVSQHKKDHQCGLEFVHENTGEIWQVKENPALTAIHQSNLKNTSVHIRALKSPRYLFGGNFIAITEIETIPEEVANRLEREASVPPTHVCSLSATRENKE